MHTFWLSNQKGRDHSGDLWHTWKDNIRMDLREIGWEGVVWMHQAQDRDHLHALVKMVVNLPVP
jgi:hypothetical protein